MLRGRSRFTNDDELDFIPVSTQNSEDNDLDFTPVTNKLDDLSAAKYLDFCNYIVHSKTELDRLDTLGAVSEDPGYYFVDSELSKEYAKDFLQAFWSIPNNIELTLANHEKSIAYHQVNQKNPSCIAFTAATINDKDYCFISHSQLNHHSTLAGELIKFVNQYNQRPDKTAEFVILRGNLTKFAKIINLINDTNFILKGCPELYTAFGLTKLYLMYGDKLFLNGASSCHFYPYSNKDKNAMGNEIIELNNGIRVRTIHCCQSCQSNKTVLLKILKAAQDAGIEADKNQIETQRRSLSPLRHSIKTHSTLVDQSLFSRQGGHSNHECRGDRRSPFSHRPNIHK